MTERIERLTELTLHGEMFVETVKTEFDRTDLFLEEEEKNVKRLCAYILNQEPKITEYSRLTGFFRFDGSVVGDAFGRSGHPCCQRALENFYLKPIDNLSTMEWQHATADYARVLKKGYCGIIRDIEASLRCHKKPEELSFLDGLKKTAQAMIAWGEKCALRVREFARKVEREEYRKNLLILADTLERVPAHPPQSFYEAVLTIYVSFSADPDSVGTLDRYLAPFYEKDLQEGRLTREEAGEYLQELFLMLQAKTSADNPYFTRGGESHFCIGGYLADGSDCFGELSRLIVESLCELPTYCPQITLRWTKKLSREDFRFCMDAERHDPHKRLAFTNDDRRMKSYTEICHIPFERAVNYTAVGCNEPAFLGAITGSNSKGNILRCVDRLFHEKSVLIENTLDFEDFYTAFEKELYADMDLIYDYDDKYNRLRSGDINYISSLVFNDCIENAGSLTQGGGNTVIASPMLLGITNVIDSLIVVKQFVFEEKRISMKELIKAVKADWEGFEDFRQLMLKKGCFFGNDDDLSNGVAQRLYESFYRYLKDKTNLFGYHFLVGDLLGYNIHHKWFGERTKATPDGRHDGDLLKICIGQSEGRDREGLTALLNSVARLDPHGISCGSTVTNIWLDEALVQDDESFEKTVDMMATYFRIGGIHFQLTYVSKDDLLKAKVKPEDYQSLRVRVTGFSEFFVRLKEDIQEDVIRRTVKSE